MIKYEVGVQMIEIYNEQVRDLLVSDGSNRRYPFWNLLSTTHLMALKLYVCLQFELKSCKSIWFTLTIITLDIRNTAQANGLNVPDASLIPVTSTEDVIELMRIGQKNRAVGATALNERSSRSHR